MIRPRGQGLHMTVQQRRQAVRPLLAGISIVTTLLGALSLASRTGLGPRLSGCLPPGLVSGASWVQGPRPAGLSSWALAGEPQEGQPPLYSTHTCIGQKFDDWWTKATCKFNNVCLNSSTLMFEYYVHPDYSDPDHFVAFSQATGEGMRQFSPHLLNPGHASVDDKMGWRPVVRRRQFPSEGPNVRWAPSPQALLQAIPVDFIFNFGHALFDVMVPIFNAQHLFGVYTRDAQVIILGPQLGTEERLREELHWNLNTEDPRQSLLRLTWDHNAVWRQEYAEQVLGHKGDGLVCFRTVLAGTGYLGRQMSRVDSLPYRQAAVQHVMGPAEPPQNRPVITIINKKAGRRQVEGLEDVQKVLADRFPAARVAMAEFGERPELTVHEQVKLMSETSILITPCGGMATVLTFMQPGTTAIAMNFYHTLKNRSVQMEDNYYQNMEYLDFQYMPVTLQEYEGTGDRPGCELAENGGRGQDAHYPLLGRLVHCNIRIAPGSAAMSRLVTLVDNAMLRWAARSGSYDAVESIRSKEAVDGDSAAAVLKREVGAGTEGGGAGPAVGGDDGEENAGDGGWSQLEEA